MQKSIRLSLLAALLLALISFASAQSACSLGENVLVGDLNYPSANPIELLRITNTTWFAESFVTPSDNAPFTVSSITLRLGTENGNAAVEIWTNGANGPNALLQRVNTFAASSNVVNDKEIFAPNADISLDASTTYWVVVRGIDTSAVEWTVSSGSGDSDGAGQVSGTYAMSSDAGSTWTENSDNPSFFQVSRCTFVGETPGNSDGSPAARINAFWMALFDF